VVLDACVLDPPVLRDILTGCAVAGLFAPRWSARILAEWAHAAARGGTETGPAIAALRATFPQAEVTPAPDTEAGLALPDPADAHVLAAAIDGGAARIVTLNLRDFPARALAPHGRAALSPDDFLMELWLAHPAAVADAVAGARAGQTAQLRAWLKRAKLPRLGKALSA
jgi:hypothetical protein